MKYAAIDSANFAAYFNAQEVQHVVGYGNSGCTSVALILAQHKAEAVHFLGNPALQHPWELDEEGYTLLHAAQPVYWVHDHTQAAPGGWLEYARNLSTKAGASYRAAIGQAHHRIEHLVALPEVLDPTGTYLVSTGSLTDAIATAKYLRDHSALGVIDHTTAIRPLGFPAEVIDNPSVSKFDLPSLVSTFRWEGFTVGNLVSQADVVLGFLFHDRKGFLTLAAFTIHDLGGQRVLVDSVPPKQLAAAIKTGGAQLDNLAKAQAIFQR